MIIKNFFAKLRSAYARYDSERRQVIKASGDGLSWAKQAIFAFHRGERGRGELLLERSRGIQRSIAKRFVKFSALAGEGSYRAMLEEYVEAALYDAYLSGKPIGPIRAPGIDEDIYLGGLLDFTGELARRAVTEATKGNSKEVERCYAVQSSIMSELIKMNITGPLRSKYDQAKQNLRKLEEILYDLSRRRQ